MQNLQEEELRHDDIVVINPDPMTTCGRLSAPVCKNSF